MSPRRASMSWTPQALRFVAALAARGEVLLDRLSLRCLELVGDVPDEQFLVTHVVIPLIAARRAEVPHDGTRPFRFEMTLNARLLELTTQDRESLI